MKTLLLSIACALLVSCGGGGSSAPAQPPTYSTKLMIKLATTAPFVPSAGYNTYTLFPLSSTPAESVSQQAQATGDVMLMVGVAKDAKLPALDSYLTEAVKYPNVKYVYVYDELGSEQNVIDFSKVPDTILAAQKVRAAGIKAAVSILPEVIMRSDFASIDVNAFDVIGIDVYPSGGIDWNMNGCTYNSNKLTTALKCSADKLHAMGYKGQIWYIYQAFGSTVDPNLIAGLTAQRDTIAQAPSFGIVGLVPYGFDKGAFASIGDPLYAGQGSPIESLVTY